MSEWHYHQGGQKFGPVSGTQLKELAAQGKLGSSDKVWREGLAEWVPASSVKGLFTSRGTASPPPVPTPPEALKPSSQVATGPTPSTNRPAQQTAKETQVTRSPGRKILVVAGIIVALLGTCLMVSYVHYRSLGLVHKGYSTDPVAAFKEYQGNFIKHLSKRFTLMGKTDTDIDGQAMSLQYSCFEYPDGDATLEKTTDLLRPYKGGYTCSITMKLFKRGSETVVAPHECKVHLPCYYQDGRWSCDAMSITTEVAGRSYERFDFLPTPEAIQLFQLVLDTDLKAVFNE